MRSEKESDWPTDTVAYCGIEVCSRWGKRRELEEMMAAIDKMVDENAALSGYIVSMFCDSKASACYDIACISPGPTCQVPRSLLECIGLLAERAFNGHNGMVVKSGDVEVFLDPIWPD